MEKDFNSFLIKGVNGIIIKQPSVVLPEKPEERVGFYLYVLERDLPVIEDCPAAWRTWMNADSGGIPYRPFRKTIFYDMSARRLVLETFFIGSHYGLPDPSKAEVWSTVLKTADNVTCVSAENYSGSARKADERHYELKCRFLFTT